ncbi:hypothetical protein GW17_00042397 [Ensete ventricosum]|nr:hypothetical protein GW17_00042397 [Ensete ventricosum]RZS16682.1 hypothetical protein BHM03_00048715 [Ensete ventricosum]
MPVGRCRSCGLAVTGRPLCRGPWPQPVTLCKGPWPPPVAPLHMAKPWLAAPTRGLAVAGHPSSSSLRLLGKRSKNA